MAWEGVERFLITVLSQESATFLSLEVAVAWIKAGLKFKQNVSQNCTMLAKGPAINALRLWGRRNLTPFPAFFPSCFATQRSPGDPGGCAELSGGDLAAPGG